jgi:hypothetical protein
MRSIALFLLPVAVGCYSESRFQQDSTVVYCNHVFDCAEGDNLTLALLQLAGWDDAAECIEDQAGDAWDVDGDCLYDASIARECVKKLEDMDCGDLTAPGTCSDVYDCD